MTVPTNLEKVFAMTLSDKGPLASPQNLDFRTASEYVVDFTETLQREFIDFISGVYVNNWDGEFSIHIDTGFPNQTIVVPEYSWAYLPLLVANPAKLVCRTPDGIIASYVAAIFYNIPMPPYVARRYAPAAIPAP